MHESQKETVESTSETNSPPKANVSSGSFTSHIEIQIER